MASVHFTMTATMNGTSTAYNGSPRGETESSGGETTIELGNGEVCRAKAVSGASYVRMGGSGNPTASDGYYLAEGDIIDMTGAIGDTAFQADA